MIAASVYIMDKSVLGAPVSALADPTVFEYPVLWEDVRSKHFLSTVSCMGQIRPIRSVKVVYM